MEKAKRTLVLGASENPSRYSNIAINRLRDYKQDVVAIGKRKGKVNDVEIMTEHPIMDDIDTITLYLNPANQVPYYDYIMSLKPRRVIFNPGTENDDLERKLVQKGVVTQEACTLVMLSTGQY